MFTNVYTNAKRFHSFKYISRVWFTGQFSVSVSSSIEKSVCNNREDKPFQKYSFVVKC